RMNSAALPKVTFSRPPMAGPARSATCSVARRIQVLSGMIAAAPAANTQSGATDIHPSASDSGIKRSGRNEASMRSGIRDQGIGIRFPISGSPDHSGHSGNLRRDGLLDVEAIQVHHLVS